MRLQPLSLQGAQIVHLDPYFDERGSFVRTWCRELFSEVGLMVEVVQANQSRTSHRGTVRGLHFQRRPHADSKLVRVSRGRIFDVLVDLREDSSTRGQACCVELDENEFTLLFVPEGCAHGFQSLTDNVVTEYFHSDFYSAPLYDGFRFDDPAVDIVWPLPVAEISQRDLSWRPLQETFPWIANDKGLP